MKDLLILRDEIDLIDHEITTLFLKRMAISEEVAEYKIANNKAVFDRQREVSKLEVLSGRAKESLLKNGIRELFEQIMSTSRKRQYQLLAGRGITEKTDFEETENLVAADARIVFQGTEGAYSQLALKEYFGADKEGRHVDTWRDAMEAIQNNEADYAVLPIENSSAGIVSENYDLLMEYDNCIVGEQIIKIDHALLALPGTKINEIRDIYSHPQALMQCARYLEAHREWETHSYKNTAMAARKVKEDKRKEQAAIASGMTADIYGLTVLEESVQDNKNNFTRFLIVAGKKLFNRKANKISICFEIPHESGSLYHTLSHFIYNGINLNKIESRPIPGKAWEYRFFVDFDGNLNDASVKNALKGLKEETVRLKILGNYYCEGQSTAEK